MGYQRKPPTFPQEHCPLTNLCSLLLSLTMISLLVSVEIYFIKLWQSLHIKVFLTTLIGEEFGKFINPNVMASFSL
jgi:hypothetical protein